MKYFSFFAAFAFSIPVLFFTAPAFASSADITPPNVGAIHVSVNNPAAATFVRYSLTAKDNVGISSCHLFIDGSDDGEMVRDWLGHFYALSHFWTASDVGSGHSVQAKCTDLTGNIGVSQPKNFHVAPGTDMTAPIVSIVSSSKISGSTSVEYSATFADSGSGVVSCALLDNGVSLWDEHVTWKGTVIADETLSLGAHVLVMQCTDAAGNVGSGLPLFVAVPASVSTGTTPPEVGIVTANIDNPAAATTVEYEVKAKDDVGISSCHLFIDGSDAGNMSFKAHDVYTLSHFWPASNVNTVHTARAQCADPSGDVGVSLELKYFYVTPGKDTIVPIVSTVEPTKALNILTEYSATYSDSGSDVVTCSLLDGGIPIRTSKSEQQSLLPPFSQGEANVYGTLSQGIHILTMRCTDAAGNVGNGPATSVTVSTTSTLDTTAPDAVTVRIDDDKPIAGTTAEYSTFIGTPNDISSCHLFIDGSNIGKMLPVISKYPIMGGSPPPPDYALGHFWPASNVDTTHSVQAKCTNSAGNIGVSSAIKYFHVAPGGDITSPIVGAVSPTTAPNNTSVKYSAPFTDSGSGVVTCSLFDASSTTPLWTSKMWSPSSQGVSTVIETLSSGRHLLTMRCTDATGNVGSSPQTSVNISASSNTVSPIVSIVSTRDLNPPAVSTVKYYVDAQSNAGSIASCHLFIDGSDTGKMSNVRQDRYVLSHFWPASNVDTTHSVQAKCTNSAGKVGISAGILYFHVAPGGDVAAPIVGTVSQTKVSNSTSVKYSAPFTDSGSGVVTCSLFGSEYKPLWTSKMWSPSSQGVATVIETLQPGRHLLTMRCTDAAGNIGSSLETSFTVSASSNTVSSKVSHDITQPASTSSCAYPVGQLVKLPDDGNPATMEDSAVYYYANDCERHVFPNAKVFFTWYQNFNNVQTVTASELAQMPLGANVTYRPGVRLVKFLTDPKVYAVSHGGVLRWVSSESVASSLYGPTWNSLVNDIPDAFYANYTFGKNIEESKDFQITNEEASAKNIDDSLR